jgi:hypothetical protein
MTRIDDFAKCLMISTAWKYASHFGGADNMTGMLHVIKNRQKAGFGDYIQIVDTMSRYEACPPVTTTNPSPWDRRFLQLLQVVDSVCDDTRKDHTNGALYAGDLTCITNDWFLEKVARSPDKQRCGDNNSWTYFKSRDF